MTLQSILDFAKTWGGRLIVAAAGVVSIVTTVTQHSAHPIGGIVTGVCAIVFAIYATIRGVAGDAKVSLSQAIGLIDVTAWYDFVVAGVLIVVAAVSWAF